MQLRVDLDDLMQVVPFERASSPVHTTGGGREVPTRSSSFASLAAVIKELRNTVHISDDGAERRICYAVYSLKLTKAVEGSPAEFFFIMNYARWLEDHC